MASLLYVDDEESIGRVVTRFFERRGDQVHLAHSVAEAVAVLQAHSPHVVFIDVWLGSESGLSLVDWINAHRPELAERVVFVTGDDLSESARRNAGASLDRPVVLKPFELDQLAQCVVDAERRATG